MKTTGQFHNKMKLKSFLEMYWDIDIDIRLTMRNHGVGRTLTVKLTNNYLNLHSQERARCVKEGLQDSEDYLQDVRTSENNSGKGYYLHYQCNKVAFVRTQVQPVYTPSGSIHEADSQPM